MPNPGPATTISPSILLGASSPEGYMIGNVSTTPVGFYGVSGVPQRSNANQLTVSSGAPAGVLLSVRTVAIAPPGADASTSISAAFTTTGSPISSGDVVIVNAITGLTAGAGIGGARAHTATTGAVIMQFFNLTAAAVTATAAQQYLFAALRGLTNSVALTPAGIGANSVSEQTFNVTGVAPGDLLYVSKPSEQVDIGLAGCRVAGNNQIAITFLNQSTAPITPTAAETYTVFASNGMQAASNLMVYGVNVGTALTPPVTTTTQSWAVTEQTLTMTSIRVSDFLVGVSKPTMQGNFGIVGQRVSGVNQLALSLGSGTLTGITPTGSQIYQALIYRQQPDAPLTVLSVTCTPAAIAGQTSAEQAFTVTPMPADSILWVNKPTATAGIGIVNCRVSAAGVAAITFANTLVSTTVTPPAEVYLFGIVTPTPSGGSNINMQVARGAQGAIDKANELGTALTAMGAITGGTP